jgi:hypothetical protein
MRFAGTVLLALMAAACATTARAEEVGQVDRAKGALKTFEDKTSTLTVKEPVQTGLTGMALGELAHQIWIRTPQLTARPEGTSFRMLVDPKFGTFVATDKGIVKAELKGDHPEPVTVTAGHWLLVQPNGTILRDPPLPPFPDGMQVPPPLDCCG